MSVANCIRFLGIVAFLFSRPVVIESVDRYGEQSTIEIAPYGHDSETCLTNKSRPCRSVGYVLGSKELNNTLVLIKRGFYPLNTTITIENVVGLNITGDGLKQVILCKRNNESGLVFRKCENVSLVNFELQSCGSKFKTSSEVKHAPVFAFTALLMEHSKNVEWTGVRICNSSGIGSVFYDVTGNVQMNNVTFESNSQGMAELSNTSNSLREVYNAGGGINIEFRPNTSAENSTYLLRYCKFSRNTVGGMDNNKISDSIGRSYFSLGRGGAISFITRGDRSGNQLMLDTCVFTGNRALWGAGIFCEFNDRSGRNSIKVNNSQFSNNMAVFAGGAIRVGVNSNCEREPNTVEVYGSKFDNNKAKMGGAFSEYQTMKQRESTVFINHCSFQNNAAVSASNIHLQNVNATLIDITVITSKKNLQNKQGSMCCYLGHILFQGYILVQGAKSTGFVLEFCELVLNGTANFTGNSGTNGGAMTMYGNAKIRFTTGSRLILHHNRVTNRGGAIYVETPVPLNETLSTQLNIYKCFFIFGDTASEFKHADTLNTTIDFYNNTALPRGGDNVWATTISWCRGEDENNLNNTALKWKIIKSNGKLLSTNKTVVTSPRSIHYDQGQWDAHPGIPIHPRVTLHDENWNIVNGTVHIKIVPTKGTLSNSEFDFTMNGDTSVHIKGVSGSEYNINLKTLDRFTTSTIITNRKLKDCPPGFYLKSDTCICQPISKGVTHCDTESNSVYVIPWRWGNIQDNSEFAEHTCPMHYCQKRKNDGIGFLFNQKDQCAEGRDSESALCSKCKANHSVLFGSETCEKLNSDRGILWLLLFAVVLTVIVFLIMLVNLDTYSTYLNGFLYSYQIIPLLIIDEEYVDHFISLAMTMINVSGTGKIQSGIPLWVGMNDMNKLLLNYLAPVFLVLCTLVFGALSTVYRRCPFNKRTTFRALVFISIIAYADFTKLSFKILRPVKISGHYYAYFAAYMPYFGKEHASYASVAVIISLLIVIGFPLALMFSNYVIRFKRFVKLMGIFDTFEQPFRREPYIKKFAVFYFLNRLLLLTIYVSMQDGPLKDIIFAIACVVILIIFIVCTPYRDWKMNFFDGLQLTNIVFMAIVYTGYGVAYETNVRIALMKINWALAYVPLLCIIYRIAAWVYRKIQLWNERSKYLDLPCIIVRFIILESFWPGYQCCNIVCQWHSLLNTGNILLFIVLKGRLGAEGGLRGPVPLRISEIKLVPLKKL